MPKSKIPAKGVALPAKGRRDPALDAVAKYDAAHAAFMSAPADDKVQDPLHDAREKTVQKLGRVKPTTEEGAMAILRRMVESEADFVDKATPFVSAVLNVIEFFDNRDRPATVEQMAKHDFRAWKHTKDEWTPPTEAELVEWLRPGLRICWGLLHKSPAELQEIMRVVDSKRREDRAQREVMREMLNLVPDIEEYLEVLRTIAASAHSRLLVSGAKILVNKGRK